MAIGKGLCSGFTSCTAFKQHAANTMHHSIHQYKLFFHKVLSTAATPDVHACFTRVSCERQQQQQQQQHSISCQPPHVVRGANAQSVGRPTFYGWRDAQVWWLFERTNLDRGITSDERPNLLM